ncbi:MAG: diaminopimelate epimerase [Cryomorphaceae bacterium]|nr:diaminopimelate epimerase [Cryomorphaceae bacterium]
MTLSFDKYQGTGNDFILIDNRNKTLSLPGTVLVKSLCDRRFGIGGDGLILLQNHPEYDFEMIYYNSDGNISTMCGNGGRCIVAFANALDVISNKTTFLGPDGAHKAEMLPNGEVRLKMKNAGLPKVVSPGYELNTGSPHLVVKEKNISTINVRDKGAKFRHEPAYENEGINVNFMQRGELNELIVRTYERGVEDETYSCGTGVTACAITAAFLDNKQEAEYMIRTLGGTLAVSLKRKNTEYRDIWLTGPAKLVFSGEIEIS